MNQDPYIANNETGRALLNNGSEIAGSTAGALAGLFIGGSVGEFAAATLIHKWVTHSREA